jgi:hypothetical protein
VRELGVATVHLRTSPVPGGQPAAGDRFSERRRRMEKEACAGWRFGPWKQTVLVVMLLGLWGGVAVAKDRPSYPPELRDDYQVVGLWEEEPEIQNEKTDGPGTESITPRDQVVVDWGISNDDLDGWPECSPQPYGARPADVAGRPATQICYRYEQGAPEECDSGEDCTSEDWALWDIETYSQDRLRRYAAVWRKAPGVDSFLTRSNDLKGFQQLVASAGDYELVDFECYLEYEQDPDDPHVRFLALWHKGAANQKQESQQFLEPKEFRELHDVAPRIRDLEMCDKQALLRGRSAGSSSYIVLLEEGSSDSGEGTFKTGFGGWQDLHDAFHHLPVETLELESIPVATDPERGDPYYSEWQYVWVWKELDEDQGSKDWLMTTDRFSYLEREVLRLDETVRENVTGHEACSEDRRVRLTDILIGADEVPDSDRDGQHPEGHGDGSGGVGG